LQCDIYVKGLAQGMTPAGLRHQHRDIRRTIASIPREQRGDS